MDDQFVYCKKVLHYLICHHFSSSSWIYATFLQNLSGFLQKKTVLKKNVTFQGKKSCNFKSFLKKGKAVSTNKTVCKPPWPSLGTAFCNCYPCFVFFPHPGCNRSLPSWHQDEKIVSIFRFGDLELKPFICHYYLVGAQPPPCCSFARHLVGKIVIHCSFAHH